MTPGYDETIEEAASCEDASDALRLLDGYVATSGETKAGDALPRPRLRSHQKLLAGILMRAGRFEDARRIVTNGPAERPQRSPDAVIVDPGFVHLQGHHHNSNVFFKRLIQQRGFSVSVLRMITDHASFQDDDTGSIPTFSLSPYEKGVFRHISADEELRLLNRFFAHEFARTLPHHGARLMVVPVARHTFVDGLCHYLQACVGRTPMSLVLGIVEPDAVAADHPLHAPVRETYRRAFAKLRSLPGLRIEVLVETSEVADFLRGITGAWAQIIVMPYVAGYLKEVGRADRKPSGQPVIGFVGQSRPERGALLIPEIADRTLATYPGPFSWRVQLDAKVVDRKGTRNVSMMLERLRKRPQFEMHRTDLTFAEYYRLMDSLDIMVLPYSPRYDATGSGVAIESLGFGHVQVVPERSSMARTAARYGAGTVVFSALTVDAVASAVIEALERLVELKERSARALDAIRKDVGPLERLTAFVKDA